jgi:hypothetical protein
MCFDRAFLCHKTARTIALGEKVFSLCAFPNVGGKLLCSRYTHFPLSAWYLSGSEVEIEACLGCDVEHRNVIVPGFVR